MGKRSWLWVAAGVLGCATLAGAIDWPQWRGPNRDGISKETGLLKEWPAEGPKLLWQVNDIGFGYSTPAVVGQRLYLLSNRGLDNEFVQALDAASGRQIWATTLGKVGPNRGPNYPGARSTPTVDGELLYALGSDGDLACLETASGTIRWKKNLRTDFGGQPGSWAYAESPLIDGEVLVCTPGGSQATIVALNKLTGETIWKSAVPGGDPAAFASAVIGEVGGVRQYIQFLGKGLVGVEAKTGRFLWRYDKTSNGGYNIPTPIFHEGEVFSLASKAGAGLVKLAAEGDQVAANEIYFTPRLQNHIGGAVLLDGHIYSTTNEALVCMEFQTGDIKWQERSAGKGSLFYADGRLYLHREADGVMVLVAPSPEGYQEKGRFTPPGIPTDRGQPAGKSWAYPVVANGQLYVRDLGTLWCYDVQDPKAGQ